MAGGSMGTHGITNPVAGRHRSARARGHALLLTTLALALATLLGLGTTGGSPAHAAGAGNILSRTPAPTRPAQGVAYARIAVVRVLAYYAGSSANLGQVPVQTACAADGVLVGTVGGTNSFNYVLVPSAAVSPIIPCEGVQAAYSELYGSASSWSLTRVTVLLSAAYTGTGATQLGSITYSIDAGNITTDGGPTAPRVLALPLAVGAGAPSHDLPLLSVPQPSDAPATDTNTALDLVAKDGQLLARDSLQPQEINTTLYPVDLSAAELAPVSSSTGPTPAAPSQNANGGTVLPATAPATASSASNAEFAQQLALGAPIINSNGRLVGMIVLDAEGNHVVASTAQLTAAVGSINIRPGPLMSTWQQGLVAFYSASPDYATASAAFAKLQQADPDFGGVAPFLAAAQGHSSDIAPLTGTPAPTATSPGTVPTTPASQRPVFLAVLGGGALLVLLLCVVVAVLVMRRGRAPNEPPPEERGLDLLPRETMYGVPPAEPVAAGRAAVDMAAATTLQMRATQAPAADAIAATTTVELPAVRSAPAVSRSILALVPRAAGATDPGIKRGGEPNQDTILAVTGTRLAAGRTQPFALLAVADGMGGHNNGRDASILTIGMLGRTVLPVMTGQQALDNAAVVALVRDAIQRAHAEMRQRNKAGGVDMGTTVTAALVLDDQAHVFNVGDSRTYLLSPDAGLRQVTTDHSIVASLVAAGVIKADDAYHHPRRNQIYRSLGGEEETIEIDSFLAPLQAGDKLLLCSDGLWEMVRDPQLDHILRATADPTQAAQLLVREANANGGEDNIGIVVARLVEEVPEPGKTTLQPIVVPAEAEIPGLA